MMADQRVRTAARARSNDEEPRSRQPGPFAKGPISLCPMGSGSFRRDRFVRGADGEGDFSVAVRSMDATFKVTRLRRLLPPD